MGNDSPSAKYEVSYLYRDASNCKFRGRFVVQGYLDLEALRPFLFDEEWFVPERVGLAPLRPRETNEDDHLLHEFEAITPYSGPEPGIAADGLTRRIREIGPGEAWFRGMSGVA
jgi:hypothetical protein